MAKQIIFFLHSEAWSRHACRCDRPRRLCKCAKIQSI